MKVKNPTVVIQSDQAGHIEVTSTPGVEVVCLDSNYTEISPDELGAEDDDFLDDEPVETPKLDKLLSEPGCFFIDVNTPADYFLWDFQRDPETGVYPQGLEAIGQALGAASACWTNLEHAGTFESDRAKYIAQRLYDVLFPPEIGPTNPADEARLAAVDRHIAGHHAALAAVRDFNRWHEDLRAPLERRSGESRRQRISDGHGRRINKQPTPYAADDRRSSAGRRGEGQGRRSGEKF